MEEDNFLSVEQKTDLEELIIGGLLFADGKPDHLACSNCRNVAIRHHLCRCGLLFCKSCYELLAKEQGQCNECNFDMNEQMHQSKEIELVLYDLKAVCPNNELGCKENPTLSNLLTHLIDCRFDKAKLLPIVLKENKEKPPQEETREDSNTKDKPDDISQREILITIGCQEDIAALDQKRLKMLFLQLNDELKVKFDKGDMTSQEVDQYLHQLSPKQLKDHLKHLSIDIKSVIEKNDLVALLKQHQQVKYSSTKNNDTSRGGSLSKQNAVKEEKEENQTPLYAYDPNKQCSCGHCWKRGPLFGVAWEWGNKCGCCKQYACKRCRQWCYDCKMYVCSLCWSPETTAKSCRPCAEKKMWSEVNLQKLAVTPVQVIQQRLKGLRKNKLSKVTDQDQPILVAQLLHESGLLKKEQSFIKYFVFDRNIEKGRPLAESRFLLWFFAVPFDENASTDELKKKASTFTKVMDVEDCAEDYTESDIEKLDELELRVILRNSLVKSRNQAVLVRKLRAGNKVGTMSAKVKFLGVNNADNISRLTEEELGIIIIKHDNRFRNFNSDGNNVEKVKKMWADFEAAPLVDDVLECDIDQMDERILYFTSLKSIVGSDKNQLMNHAKNITKMRDRVLLK